MEELRPARLYTLKGDRVFRRSDAPELRCSPVALAQDNLWIDFVSVSGPDVFVRLRFDPSGPSSPGAVANSDAAASSIKMLRLERGVVAFVNNGLFLAVLEDGRVAFERGLCSASCCFLASEDWCSGGPHLCLPENFEINRRAPEINLSMRDIAEIEIDPRVRAHTRVRSGAPRLLIFGDTFWSHGRVYFELCRRLTARGFVVDLLHWRRDHADSIATLASAYDLFLAALDGIPTLTDVYGIAPEQIVAISHSEFDVRFLLREKGRDVFDRFANYGVVSDAVYAASQLLGIARPPMVARLGVSCAEFHMPVADSLQTIGYASNSSLVIDGIELKRGALARQVAERAGLAFSQANEPEPISFLDMPSFYSRVEAVLTTSLSESGPLTILEAAAAGRLAFATAVGHVPPVAEAGGCLIAPMEPARYVAFVAERLNYYKANPAAYRERCLAAQAAAKRFDWDATIGDWVELILAAQPA